MESSVQNKIVKTMYSLLHYLDCGQKMFVHYLFLSKRELKLQFSFQSCFQVN